MSSSVEVVEVSAERQMTTFSRQNTMVGFEMNVSGQPHDDSQVSQGSKQSSASSVLATDHQAIQLPALSSLL